MTVNILFPVLNEELRLARGIEQTIAYLREYPIFDYILTIVDNGSTDSTSLIAKELEKKYDQVSYIHLNEKGVGIALREGFKRNDCPIIGYMDIDLSTKLIHLKDMYDIFQNNQDIAIVNGSRLHKNSKVIGKKLSRKIMSRGLKIILNIFLGMKITDCICGFKFFRQEVLKNLIERSSNEKGWFFCIEIMLRAEKLGLGIQEIPVIWEDNPNTTVNTRRLIKEYLVHIFRLYKELIIKKKI